MVRGRTRGTDVRARGGSGGARAKLRLVKCVDLFAASARAGSAAGNRVLAQMVRGFATCSQGPRVSARAAGAAAGAVWSDAGMKDPDPFANAPFNRVGRRTF
jgi:hypothetical protein